MGRRRSRRRGRSGRSPSDERGCDARALRDEIQALRAEVGRLQARDDGFAVSHGGRAGKGRRGGGGGGSGARPLAAHAGGQSAPGGGGGGTGDPKPGDWTCQVCGESNWQSRAHCRSCRTSRRGYAAAAADPEFKAVRAQQAAELQARAERAHPAGTARQQAPRPATGANAIPLPVGADARAPATVPAVAGGGGGDVQPREHPGAEPVGEAAAADPAGGGQPPGGPGGALAAAAARKHQEAVRAEETRRLARLDTAIAALDAEPDFDPAVFASLQTARVACAARIADTQPLGRRLAAARKAHAKAAAALRRAEEAATSANEAAQTALTNEHRLRAEVAVLEAKVAAVRPPNGAKPAECEAPARALLDGLHAWAASNAVPLPPELLHAAAALEEAVAPPRREAEGEDGEAVVSSPTVPVPSSEADSDEDMGALSHAGGLGTSGASNAVPGTAALVPVAAGSGAPAPAGGAEAKRPRTAS